VLNAAVKRVVLSSFLNVSVEAGGVDSENSRVLRFCRKVSIVRNLIKNSLDENVSSTRSLYAKQNLVKPFSYKPML